MTYEDVESVLQRLESADDPFDYEKSVHYVQLVKDFVGLSRAYCEQHGLAFTTPFHALPEIPGELPEATRARIADIARRRRWDARCAKVLCEYLLIVGQEELQAALRSLRDVYAPLIELFFEGGDFYPHHGDICIRDAATVIRRW